MGCVSGKMSIKLTEKDKLEIEKLEGSDLSLKLVELVDNIDKMKKDDKVYVMNHVRSYLAK
jgi:UPF0288 family protein (methanogenesis marker protein 3)